MIKCQHKKFNLPDSVSYLNCAYISPLLKSVEKIGHTAVSMKNMPYEISTEDFFAPVDELKKNFAKLIDVDEYERIALIPGVSYGIANVAKNIFIDRGENIVVASEQFPSNIYPWQQKIKECGGELKTVFPAQSSRGKSWNENLLNAINEKTKVVALSHVHWTDGTLFELKMIRKKCDEVNAYLVVDGSQSIGALPFSVKDIMPDALVCAGYKWLMGPYSLGLAYYSEKFDDGIPIEPCWINKKGSEDFRSLANYTDNYKPMAMRYNVSESSNFILVPMLNAAIEQLLEWSQEAIQAYCAHISYPALKELAEIGCLIEEKRYRANHLFGIRLNEKFDLEKIKRSMMKNHVHVSFRGNAIRVAPHLYNTAGDFEQLVSCIKNPS